MKKKSVDELTDREVCRRIIKRGIDNLSQKDLWQIAILVKEKLGEFEYDKR